MPEKKPSNLPPIVWWVIWAALMSGVFIIYFTISASMPTKQKQEVESGVWMIGMTPFLISSVLRWLILSRKESAQSAFPIFIMGLAMAEATCILGLFVFPAYSTALFALSVLGIAQYVPYFAAGFEEKP